MKKYMLILFEGDHVYTELSPEDLQQEIMAHGKWIEELGDRFLGGEALEEPSKIIRGKEKVVTDGPYIESKELVGGYYLIAAKDLEEATEISKGCPVLQYGGGIEVRPVMEIDGMDE